eukprot:504621-Pleurochrysis_carterae.AAC.1
MRTPLLAHAELARFRAHGHKGVVIGVECFLQQCLGPTKLFTADVHAERATIGQTNCCVNTDCAHAHACCRTAGPAGSDMCRKLSSNSPRYASRLCGFDSA